MDYYFMLRISSSSWSREPSSRPIHFSSHYVYTQFSRTLFAGINNRQSIKLDRADDESFHLVRKVKKRSLDAAACTSISKCKVNYSLGMWQNLSLNSFISIVEFLFVSFLSSPLPCAGVASRLTHVSHRIASPSHTTQIIKQSDLCGALYHIGRISLALWCSPVHPRRMTSLFSVFFILSFISSLLFSPLIRTCPFGRWSLTFYFIHHHFSYFFI